MIRKDVPLAQVLKSQIHNTCIYVHIFHIELSLFDNVNYWLFAFGKVYFVTSEAVRKNNFRYGSIIYKLIKEGQTRLFEIMFYF